MSDRLLIPLVGPMHSLRAIASTRAGREAIDQSPEELLSRVLAGTATLEQFAYAMAAKELLELIEIEELCS